MNGSLAPLVIGLAALAIATVAGIWLVKRDGAIRETGSDESDEKLVDLLREAGFAGSGPAVVHFSAVWCAPCAAVRRVVAGVVEELASTPFPPQDLEIDIDENPRLSAHLKVLSLPTTFILDRSGAQRYRAAGVPTAAVLRETLGPLTT